MEQIQITTVDLETVPTIITKLIPNRLNDIITDTILAEFLRGKVIRVEYGSNNQKLHISIAMFLKRQTPLGMCLRSKGTQKRGMGMWYFYLEKMDL